MAGLEVLTLLIVVPAIAWLIALVVFRNARAELARDGPLSVHERPPQRIVVFSGYSGAPVAFGIILYLLAQPALRVIDGPAAGIVLRLEPLVLWAAFAFSVASCSAMATQTWIVRSRLREFLGPSFGRVLTISVVPATATVFALVSMFQLLVYADSVLAGRPAASDSAVADAVRSFQAFAVGTIAFPVAAEFSNRVRDLTQRGFVRALLILEFGELPVLVGLVLIFFAIHAL